MELKKMQYLVTIADEGTISKAAARLHITQPALSRQIQELESETGKRLFLRGARTITLTSAGRIFYDQAIRILELSRNLEQTMKEQCEEDTDLRIGGAECAGMAGISQVLAVMRKQGWNGQIHMRTGTALETLTWLEDGKIDFCLVAGHIDLEHFDWIRLGIQEKWGVLVTRDHPFAGLESIEEPEFSTLPVIASDQALQSGELSWWMRNAKIVGTYDLIRNAGDMTKAGLGCPIVLCNLSDDPELISIPFWPEMKLDLYLAWKKGRQQTEASRIFLDLCSEQLTARE